MNNSTEINRANTLSMLFTKTGFRFLAYDENGISGKVSEFKVTNLNRWEDEVIKELEINLRLRRNYTKVHVAFVSSFFNLVPDSYLEVSSDVLLNLSEAEFEVNEILTSPTKHGNTIFFGVSQLVSEKLTELYAQVEFVHSGKVFMDHIVYRNYPELHLNLFDNQLEIIQSNDKGIVFYNLYDVQSDEDILFFTLFAAEQLNVDLNKIDLICYGELLPGKNVYQTFKKYVRYLLTASKDEAYLINYTLNNLA